MEFAKECDWNASAADRFIFPKSPHCSSKFAGDKETPFIHPLSSEKLSFSTPLMTSALAEEKFQSTIGSVDRDLDFKTKFFLYWRRWPEESSKHNPRLAYLPADTRIPDHTIWNHMSLTSALQSCVDNSNNLNAAFLIFQLGPVQDFIEQARSSRDMWSGSYMISWLTAHALRVVADQIGPDSVIFPSLRGLPVFDVLFKELYQKSKLKDGNDLWKALKYKAEDLQMPVIPNRFCAVVPAWRAAEIAYAAEAAAREELKSVSKAALESFKKMIPSDIKWEPNWDVRWNSQVEKFLQIMWQITAWECPENFDEMDKFAKLAKEGIPPNEQDKRCYPLKSGFFWSDNYRYCEAALAARRNTREFDAFKTDDNQSKCPKDPLSGKEEIIGSEELWKYLSGGTDKIFKDNESHGYGALNIIKRLWCSEKCNYLRDRLGVEKLHLYFDSLEDVAKKNKENSPYVAVIALDGDNMGKYLNGKRTPELLNQLSEKARDYFKDKCDETYRRPLSPSYHLQFSESLSNFARHIAGNVVSSFSGELIYSGGDDVLAVLPADRALACASVLRSCFRGESNDLLETFAWLCYDKNELETNVTNPGWIDSKKMGYPLMMPGGTADVSCGIAIAHYRHPLQHAIKEARTAEKRAKNDYNRGAFSLSLLKRSGEIIHFGSKWTSGALKLFYEYCTLRQGGEKDVSGRFPYALAALLEVYRFKGKHASHVVKHSCACKQKTGDNESGNDSAYNDQFPIVREELKHVLEQQVNTSAARKKLCELSDKYLTYLKDNECNSNDFLNLFLVASFIERDRGGEA